MTDEHGESSGVGAPEASPPGRGRSPLGIDRFVLFRLHAGVSRDDAIARVRAAFAGEHVTIGTPADASAQKWDVSVVIRTADLDAMAAALARASELLDVWLPAHTAVIKAWSFELRP